MGAVNLPDNIQDGEDLLAGPVMANFQAITQTVNGSLEANANVSTASAVTQPGSTNAEGVAASIARSDHKHLIQGFENLAADPTTGNFKGRVYWNTVTNELRYCEDATGSGTFGSLTPTATELVIHAAQHKDGGHDPLADNTLTDHMFAAKGTIFSVTLGADSASFSGTGWTTIIDLTTITTTGQQTLGIAVQGFLQASGGSGNPNAALRLVDVTASNTTIWMSPIQECDAGIQNWVSGYFYYTTPAGGARTIRLQGGATSNVSGGVIMKQPAGFNTNSVVGPTMQAVIL